MPKKWFCISLLLWIAILVLATSNPGRAQENALGYQPVVVKGARLPDFLGVPVNALSLWAFDSSSHTWRPVPFQIDERTPSGSYCGSHNRLLDGNDELVFMLKDLGDRATEHEWISDAASQKYPR